jgi:glycosyltransferase involved in cell wall biosynthesis
MRIAVVKPEWNAQGGFERLLDQLIGLLENSDHDVSVQPVPAILTPRPVWGIPEAEGHWRHHPEFFRFFVLAEDTRRLDLRRFDLVMSTQPPTYLADHPNVMALFYHQARVFYDLAQPFGALGDVDPAHHRAATAIVRDFEQPLVSNVRHWLAGSNECRERLTDFWGISDNVSLIHAPALTEVPDAPPPWSPDGPVLCVSRHEWPKRTELLVAAAHRMGGRAVHFVGGGGRLPFVKALDAAIGAGTESEPDLAWMRSAVGINGPEERPHSPVQFLGNVTDRQRNDAYASASVVVAPAYREDYGLTALEAMLWKRPLIVCSDGGGLVDLVNETGAGLIVEPTSAGIAAGVSRIINEPGLAATLLERADAVPAAFTWDRCHAELDAAIEAAAP